MALVAIIRAPTIFTYFAFDESFVVNWAPWLGDDVGFFRGDTFLTVPSFALRNGTRLRSYKIIASSNDQGLLP